MATPERMPEKNEIDLKLGIKSSLSNVKGAIALVYLLWKSSDRKAALAYSEANGTGIRLAAGSEVPLKALLSPLYAPLGVSDDEFMAKINENPLFQAQIEHLNVAFELIWRLAKLAFADGRPLSAERTGGNRYEKRIYFTKNLDLIDLLVSENPDEYNKIFLKWATDFELTLDANREKKLIEVLTILSEEAVYKLKIGNEDVRYNLNGVYKKLADGETSVDISGEEESKGPLRILKSSLAEGLNPYLSYRNGTVTLAPAETLSRLTEYQRRVAHSLSLWSHELVLIDEKPESGDAAEHADIATFSHNRILFGAPGTGKSHTLEEDRRAFGERYERVTFHANYSFGQFVGTYKPVAVANEITYKYVPGPFMRLLVKAMKDPGKLPHLLIIEEMNRANVAAVFGDVFQLLDREDGVSEYPIETSEDMRVYLESELGGTHEKIVIPANLYIWATMNSADQGVFPMDTAFKRRWDFQYIGIDDGSEEIAGIEVTLPTGKVVAWNEFRTEINTRLLRTCRVNEDKLMGPFFLKRAVLEDGAKFNEAFKSKVLMYLFEDAGKQHRKTLFSGGEYGTYSEVCRAYDEIGEGIFGFALSEGTAVSGDTEDEEGAES